MSVDTTKHRFSNNNEWRRQYFKSRRIAELHRLFRHRYRAEFYEFPEGDNSGWQDLVILLHHYCVIDPGRVATVTKTRAPWIIGTEQEAVLYAEVSKAADAKLHTAAELAEIMNLTEAERVKLGIRTIGAVDVTPKQRKEARKAADRARKAKQRRAARKQTRDEYLAANATSREKPWLSKGISRAQWYRLQRETGCSAVSKNREDTNTAEALVSRSSEVAVKDISKDHVHRRTSAPIARRRNRISLSMVCQPATSRRRGLNDRRKSQISGQRTSARKPALAEAA